MADPTVSAAAVRLVKLLVGNPPQTITDLIRDTGVTRTAVTGQLNELVAAGFAERGIERLSGRGRPHYLYNATDAALIILFAGNQKPIVPAIWRAIEELGGEALTKKVLKRVAQILADHYKQKITAVDPKQRLRELIRLFCEEGGLVEAVRQDGQFVMRKRSCPFIAMLDEKRSVCRVDLEMISQVVGRRVHRTACRHEGDPCCIFEIAADT